MTVMTVADLIPYGSENAISRDNLLDKCYRLGLATNDRQMRKLIEDARKSFVILNLSDGRGYFRPKKSDKEKLRHYVAQERDRSIAISRNLKMANALLEDMEYGRI